MSSKYDWFDSLRFGMFIHWGLFSMGAVHCWQKNFERGTNEEWERYRKHFDPDLFEPDQWAKAAREAGVSNAEFYDGTLQVFPSPMHDTDDLGLSLVHLPGIT